MSERVVLTGMVLKSMPVGEYDKRIVILTLEEGKISAFARGARRPKNALQAASNAFCFGKFEAYPGRDSYTVVRAEISNYFAEIAKDLDRTFYGAYFLEAADYFCPEGADAEDQLKLLYAAVRALTAGRMEPKLIRCVYELRTLVCNGTYPDLFHCGSCGGEDKLKYFDGSRQHMLCEACAKKQKGGGTDRLQLLDAASTYTLQYIASAPLSKLFSFRVSESVYQTISVLIHNLFHIYRERPFQSERFLPKE